MNSNESAGKPTLSRSTLRAKAEQQLEFGSTSVAAPEPTDSLVHELQVHQIELEMQNQSLRQSQLELEQSRDRYQALYEFSPVGFLTLTRTGLISEMNLTACALLGKARSKLLQRPFASLVTVKDADRWHLHLVHVQQREGVSHVELDLNQIDGTPIPVRVDCLWLTTDDKAWEIRIALTDLSASKLAEQEHSIAAIAFESTQDSMMVTDHSGVILRVNPAFTRNTGYTMQELSGKTPALLRSGRHDQFFYQKMWTALNSQGVWQGTIWNRYKNGKIYAEWLTLAAVNTPDGNVSHYVGTWSAIDSNREAEAEVYRLAYYDALTHLPNRRLLLDRLGQTLAGSARSGHYGAVLYLDIDRFKTLNDTHGHDVGDLLLVTVARRLEGCTRKENTTTRLSGDEFVVMVDDLSTDLDEAALQAKLVADKIRESLSQPYDLEGAEFDCTVSIGIVLFQGQDSDTKLLLKQADMALYQAKNAGRNIVQFFDAAMQAGLDERNALEHELQMAVTRQELQLVYQPQTDRTRRIVSAEALLRWNHPQRGLLEPEAFITLAEESGLILSIGRWVLATACAQIKTWSELAETEILTVAVNVSARQFRHKEFVSDVAQALADSGADPTHLILELTESQVIHDVADAIAKMQAIKALGVGLAMDDFGTGYSSLSVLSNLPLDQLKIDQSFIHKLDSSLDTNNAIVTQSIITLAHMLGLQVIAEGVETEAQLDFLERSGCRDYQGYLFSKPLTLKDFESTVQGGPNEKDAKA